MPGGDRTGPAGMGPMTGRGAGYCAGYSVAGYMNPVGGRASGFFGRGWGRGRGGGWGRRNWYYATGLAGWQRAAYGCPPPEFVPPYAAPVAPTMSREQEADALKGHARYLEEELAAVNKRLQDLQANKDT